MLGEHLYRQHQVVFRGSKRGKSRAFQERDYGRSWSIGVYIKVMVADSRRQCFWQRVSDGARFWSVSHDGAHDICVRCRGGGIEIHEIVAFVLLCFYGNIWYLSSVNI